MKSALLSIKPKWCAKIASGEKTIEVRKTKPKLERPFKCYIYETKGKQVEHCDGCDITYYGRGKVIGEFVCRGIMQPLSSLRLMAKESCLTEEELTNYSNGKQLYGWRISDLKIYDKPKELNKFCIPCKVSPPQSWCYLERYNFKKKQKELSIFDFI